MKQRFYSLFALLLLSMVAMASMPSNPMRKAQQDEPAVVYTLEAVKGTVAGYASSGDVVINGMTWNAPGNQSLGAYWRIGGKNLAGQARTITGKTPLNGTINYIVFHHNGVSRKDVSVDSVAVEVAEDAYFTSIIERVSMVPEVDNSNINIADSFIIAPSVDAWAAGSYYRITFYITNTTDKNGGLDFTSAAFWGEAGAELPWTPVTVQLNPETAKALKWNQVSLWAWVTDGSSSTDLFGTWPGVPVSINEETGWYSYTFEDRIKGNLNIIWSDGSNSGNASQTVDIAVSGSTCYEVSELTDGTGKRMCNAVDCPDFVNPNQPIIQVGQAKAIGSTLAVGAKTDTTYTIVGYVTKITENQLHTTYANMTFYIDDVIGGENRFYVYRGKPSVELHVGDKISVKSKVYNYNGIIETEGSMPVALLETAVNEPFADDIYDFAEMGYDWRINNATLNEVESSSSKDVFDIKQATTGEAYLQSLPNIRFQICNESADKAKAFNICPGKYFEFGGKNGVVVLRNTQQGQKITLSVAAKGSTDASLADPAGEYPMNAVAVTENLTLPAKSAGAEGADAQGYFWKNIEYVSTGGDVRIKEFSAGFRVRSIRVVSGEEIDTTQVLSVAKAIQFCSILPASQSTPNDIAVAGYVVKANEYDMTVNGQTFFIADTPEDSVNLLQAYRATPEKNNEAYPVLPGDAVILRGPLQRYVNSVTKEQIMESYAPKVEFVDEIVGDRSLPEVRVFTVAQALQRGYKMTVNHYSIATYDIQGYISAIAEDGYDQYSNMSFWMADEANNAASNAEGAFYVYRGKVTEKLQLGDFINIRTHVQNVATNNGTDSIIESIAGAKVTLLKRENDSVPSSDIPTADDLKKAGYDLINNVVLCVNFTGEATVCNDIYFVGTFSNWESSFNGCPKFAPLEGFEGWYAAEAPYSGGFQGKPIQARSDGSFSWENQCGDPNAWKWIAGNSMYLADGSEGEANMYYYSAGAYIYQMSYWKKHADLCNEETMENVYVLLTAPQNAPQEGVDVVGTFDNWNGTKMTHTEGNTYYALVKAMSSDLFKFRKAGDADWKEEIRYWDTDSATWYNMPNLSFGYNWEDGDRFGLPGYKVVSLDFSDSTRYRWTSDIPVEPDTTTMEPVCYYLIEMTDSYEDGWNDGYLTIKDGPKQMRYTLDKEDGSYKRVYVPYYGNEVSFIWNSGKYDGEVGFTVMLPNGMGLFYHAEGTDISDKELLYTMKETPCIAAPSPYNPENVKAVVTDEYKMRVTWDAVKGAASYKLYIYNPQGEEISNKANVTGTSYLSAVLKMNGEYQIRVVSVDASGMQLGENKRTLDVAVPSIPSVTIQAFAPTDCNMDVQNGMWLAWNVSGDTLLHIEPMDTEDGKLFVATFAPNAPSYDYFVLNQPSLEAENLTRTGVWMDRTESEHCSEIMYARTGYWHNMHIVGQCEFQDHNYEITNMQAQPYPGRVEFSWEAQDVEDKYILYIWDADWKYHLDSAVVNNVTTYTWAVPDQYDGLTVGWSVYPAEPYAHSHKGAGTIVLQKGAITNLYAKAGTQDGKTLDMEWAFSSDELHYLVEIKYNNTVMKREIVTAKEYHYVALFPAAYNAYVTPLSMDNEVLGGHVLAGTVELYEASAPITNLASTVNGKHITFTWNTDAPKVMTQLDLTLSNGESKFISKQEVTEKTISFDVEEEGSYTLYLSPYVESEPGKYVFTDYWYSVQAQVFTSKTYHVELNASEGGSLSPANLSGDYAEGFTINVWAYADYGYYFDSWSNGSTNNKLSLYVEDNVSVTAFFKPYLKLTLNESQGGYIRIDADEYYAIDSTLYWLKPDQAYTLTAIPSEGYEFMEWSDGNKSISRQEVMTQDAEFTAIFRTNDPAQKTYKLIISVQGVGGTVNDSVNLKEYQYGEAVIIEAKADSNYHFLKWSDGDLNAYRQILMTEDKELKAYFEGNLYTITFINYNDSLIETKQCPYGSIPSCSITPTHPNEGNKAFVFAGWEPDLAPVTGDATYKATFTSKVAAYTVTFYNWNWDELDVQYVKPGEAAVMPEDPKRKGYVFTGWKMDTDGATLADLQNVQSDLDVVATYKREEEGIDDVLSGNVPYTKILHNGVLYIVRDGKTYTITGAELR